MSDSQQMFMIGKLRIITMDGECLMSGLIVTFSCAAKCSYLVQTQQEELDQLITQSYISHLKK